MESKSLDCKVEELKERCEEMIDWDGNWKQRQTISAEEIANIFGWKIVRKVTDEDLFELV